MVPPPVGAKYTFGCSSSVNANYEEVYSIMASNGATVRVEVDDGIDRNWYEKPLYLLPTTMATKQNIRGQESSMFSIPSEFEQLKSLSVGGKYSGYVTERRPKERLEWDYTVSVLGRETVYNRAFGDLKVVTVNESRWVNVFSSNLEVQYAPDLGFPLSWKYTDSNGAEVECELSFAEGVTGAVASAGAGAAPAATQIAMVSSPGRMRAIANANIREQPSRESPRVGRLGSDARVSVAGYVDVKGERWYAMPLDNGTTGYIFGGLLKDANAPTAAAPKAPAAAKPKAPAAQVAAPAAASQPKPATTTQTAAVPRAAAPGDNASRLEKLDELRRLNLISEAEYKQKRQALLGAPQSVGIAEQLRQTNSLFRQGKINPEEFVQARAGILAKINAEDMDAKEGLVLLNDLINERLISEAEYSRKRSIMLDAL